MQVATGHIALVQGSKSRHLLQSGKSFSDVLAPGSFRLICLACCLGPEAQDASCAGSQHTKSILAGAGICLLEKESACS